MKWTVELFVDEKDHCPVLEFINAQGNTKLRAQIVRKLQHAANVGRENASEPLVKFLRDRISRLRCRGQPRILFSWEEEQGIVLALEAVRKKNGRIDEGAIDQAVANREAWLKLRRSISLDEVAETLGVK